jgi:hypothetical protein
MISNAILPIHPIWSEKRIKYKGLTKREYFVGLAMQGLIAQAGNYKETNKDEGPYTVNGGYVHPETIAKEAIAIADELLKQLDNG